MKLKNVFVFVFLFVIQQGVAQSVKDDYVVPFVQKVADLETRNITQEIIAVKQVVNYSFLKDIPSITDTFAIYAVTINKEQEIYNRFLDGNISHEEYRKRVSTYDMDTTLHTQRFNGKNQFYLYVGLDMGKGLKYVTVDCNNNNNLSDDKLYVFSLKDYESSFETRDSLRPRIQIETDYYCRRKNFQTTINMVLDPFEAWYSKKSYSSEKEYYLNVVMLTNHYQEGTVEINAKKVTVYEHKAVPNSIVGVDMNRHSRFRFFVEGDSIFPETYKVGDTLAIVDQKLYLREIRDNNLYIQQLSVLPDSSRIGDRLPDLYSNSLLNSEEVHLNELMKDMYVFIDFWGSWCRPCVASLPKLVQLHAKVKDRKDVMMLGIALEDEKEIEKLKRTIADNNVSWLNVWNSSSKRKSLSSVHGKLEITQYPTYLIVDKKGKIVYNTKFKSNSKENAISFFLDLIKE